ncbi:MAG: menaquinone biosynthesis protein [Bacteroidetes bacterium]|nr:menaquinone biosynthesis protein [Bacteroidota bacterium]
MSLIRVSAVSYLNSKPFIYGLERSDILKEIQLSIDSPAKCARKLLNNEVDIGLVPVAILPKLSNYEIISDYCIGAIGPVTSVKLYSQTPLKDIKSILLDYQSYTSVALTQILAKHFWHIDPQWIQAEEGFEQEISGTVAGVVIGDRTFELNDKFGYQYDLPEEWRLFTGLPFVFACWVTTKKLPIDFINRFNNALTKGIEAISVLSEEIRKAGKYNIDVQKYLSQNISYKLDGEKHQGLELFLNYLSQK